MKVLIVDDEKLVRTTIISLIDWDVSGFMVYDASNGREALDILCRIPMDIVITDIKMPVLDGLELLERIKSDYPGTVIIMLSCYDDFSLVKKAFKLGAFDYILKTEVDADNLLEILRRAENHINQSMVERDENIRNKKLICDGMQMAKATFLRELVWNKGNQRQFLNDEIERLGLRLSDARNYIGVFEVDSCDEAIELSKVDGTWPPAISIVNISQDILDEGGMGEIFANAPDEYIAVFSLFCRMSEREERTILQEVSGRINYAVRKFAKVSLTCGISNFTNAGYKMLFQLYKQAKTACKYRFIMGKGKVIFYSDVSMFKSGMELNKKENTGMLKSFLQDSDKINTNILKENILINKKDIKIDDFSKVRQLYDEYFYLIYSHIGENTYSGGQLESIRESYEALRYTGTLQEYNHWFTEIFESVCSGNAREGYLIRQAKRFITEHFNETISLKEVADSLNISEGHLSREFSKACECSFVQYLLRIRVEKAKEYLKKTNLDTAEIAFRVGYTSSNYFSRAFKKVTGSTMMEYRGKGLCTGQIK